MSRAPVLLSMYVVVKLVVLVVSAEWGTRGVTRYDSGVTKFRENEMQRGTRKLLFFLVATSLGLGAVVSVPGSSPPEGVRVVGLVA